MRGAEDGPLLRSLDRRDPVESETEREVRIKDRNRIDAHLRLACRVRPVRDLVVRATYW